MRVRKIMKNLLTRITQKLVTETNILAWNKKALQALWMGLLFLALMVIVKEPIGLISSPQTIDDSGVRSMDSQIDLSFLAVNQQIGSLKELVMMNNFPTNKWIVVDGLTSSCTNVTSFTQLLEWRVVVVVSKWNAYIAGCRFPRCVIISEQNLEMMQGELTVMETSKKPTKLSGFLFAIHQGAETILDTTCDTASHFNTDFLSTGERSNSYELLHNESTLFNPYEHYGFGSLYSKTLKDLRQWVEDIALTSKGVHNSILNHSDMFYLQRLKGDYIQQGVSMCYARCNNVDSKNERKSSKLPVSLGVNTVGVLDTGPTMFHKNSFLSMFVPTDLPRDQQNIFRSLFIYGIRSFTWTPFRYYPMHDSLPCSCTPGDLGESSEINEIKLRNFVQWVNGAGCSKYSEVVHCMIDVLTRVLNIILDSNRSTSKWKRSTRALMLAWLDDLASFGLDDTYFENAGLQYDNRHFHNPNATKLHFAFNQNTWNKVTKKQNNQLQKNVFDKIKNVCANISKSHPPVSVSSWKNPLMEDVMLIVVINYESLFITTPYLEYLHRHFFRYITYCGPGLDRFYKYAKDNGFTHITYINGLSRGWEYMYDCTTHAMRLEMPVKGYLQIGDDTLIDSRKFIKFQKDLIWLPGGYDKKNIYETKVLEYWGHWAKDHGRPAIINIFNELYNVSMTDTPFVTVGGKNITVSQEYRSFARRFLQTYDKNLGVRNAIHRAIDIFYIPDIVRADFLMASELFMRHGSLIEMAIPMIDFGLMPQTKIQFLKGASLWRQDRLKPWLLYDVDTMSFLHPFKSLLHLGQQEGQDFFCEAFLPHLFNYKFVGKQ